MQFPEPTKKSNIYNPDDYFGLDDIQNSISEGTTILNNDYLLRDGSNLMSGTLQTPKIILYGPNSLVQFSDDTQQITAYTQADRNNVLNIQQTTTNMSYANDQTTITGAMRISKLIFDDSYEQTTGFRTEDKVNLDNNTFKLQGTTYDDNLDKTTIANAHITSLTTGTFNSSHLSGTTSNIQSQISTNSSSIVSLDDKIDTETIRIDTERDINVRQDISLNTLQTSYDQHIIDYDTNILRIDSERDINVRQDISLNTLQTSYDQHVIDYDNYVLITDNHLEQIDTSLNSLQSENISNMESDILTLQNKTQNILYRTKGAIVDDLLHVKDIILDNVSSTGTPTIYFQSGEQISPFSEAYKADIEQAKNKLQHIQNHASGIIVDTTLICQNISFGGTLQSTAYTDSLHTKLSQMPTINNIAKLSATYIGNGIISNSEFQNLEGSTSNIQEQIDEVTSELDRLKANYNLGEFETTSLSNILGVTSLSSGTWYDGVKTWQVAMNLLFENSLYHFNLQFKGLNFNEIKVMNLIIKVTDFDTGTTLAETYPAGLFLDNARSQQPDYYINTQMYYRSTSQRAVRFSIETNYHFKAGSSTNFGIKLQVARLN